MDRTRVAAVCLAIGTVCPATAQQAASPSPAVLQLQVNLDRLGFSPGVIDGRSGTSLKTAIGGFQESHGLPRTGVLDDRTKQAIAASQVSGVVEVTLGAEDFAGPFVGAIPKEEAQQAKLPTLGYSNPLEALAERYHTTTATLVALNGPDAKVASGAKVRVPNVVPAARAYPDTLKPEWRATLARLSVSSEQPRAARLELRRADSALRVYDVSGKLVAQFPATTGSRHDPLPIGRWKVQGTSYLPPFHYNPKLFWDAGSGDKKALLPPGPNGPVGVVWMDLDKPHYGIHGTPRPENIGRTESHGCIRLANWDAARLSMMVKPGTPVVFRQ